MFLLCLQYYIVHDCTSCFCTGNLFLVGIVMFIRPSCDQQFDFVDLKLCQVSTLISAEVNLMFYLV